ncbi:hypothetical protein BS47DRAFT_55382 [Hydnum rufescens UP504]|uniref:Uncharacterized protein n=1 Tax=Hydnum rufescens UP504 TaxID=1448309 RepID=A0A9P6DQ06_9AGAM|nr:hypothetical protein BS47DRAFT_55382 [Hydnum rufescens UP504]
MEKQLPGVGRYTADLCTMCEPFPDTSTAVTRYPMKIEKKKAREESCAVSVIEYRANQDRGFLLVRRPEKGLLAGLFEFPTLELESSAEVSLVESDATALLLAKFLASPPPPKTAVPDSGSTNPVKLMGNTDAGSLLRFFSHIRMTYHIR